MSGRKICTARGVGVSFEHGTFDCDAAASRYPRRGLLRGTRDRVADLGDAVTGGTGMCPDMADCCGRLPSPARSVA